MGCHRVYIYEPILYIMKQKSIPKINDKQFEGMKLGELKKYVKDYYLKHIDGKAVKNQHTGVTILLRKPGLQHLLYHGKSGYTKFKAVVKLPEMLHSAIFCNFKNPDNTDSKDVFGYANFKSKVEIEEKVHLFRIVVRITKDGKFYYNHSVKVSK